MEDEAVKDGLRAIDDDTLLEMYENARLGVRSWYQFNNVSVHGSTDLAGLADDDYLGDTRCLTSV